MKDLRTRTITAILFGAIMIGGFVFNEWLFLALIVVINFGCTVECSRLAAQLFKKQASADGIIAGLVSSLFLCWAGIQTNTHLSLPSISPAAIAARCF